SRVVPTAQASQADSTVTLLSVLSKVPGLDGCPNVQAWQAAAEAVACQGPVSAPASMSAASAGRRSATGRCERAMDDPFSSSSRYSSVGPAGPRPGSAAVQGKGLRRTGAGEGAHGPGVAGGGGGHGEQVAGGARLGAWHAGPLGAVPVQDQRHVD